MSEFTIKTFFNNKRSLLITKRYYSKIILVFQIVFCVTIATLISRVWMAYSQGDLSLSYLVFITIAGIILITCMACMNIVQAKALMKRFKAKDFDKEFNVQVDDSAIHIKTCSGDSIINWNEIKSIVDTSEFFFIQYGNRMLPLFKSDFELGRPEDFYKYISEKVEQQGAGKYPKRGYILYSVLIVAMFFVLVNLLSPIFLVDKSFIKSAGKPGVIEPYELSYKEMQTLHPYGIFGRNEISKNSQIVSFRIPKDANSINIDVQKFKGSSDVSVPSDSTSIEVNGSLEESGFFTMQLRGDGSIDYVISTNKDRFTYTMISTQPFGADLKEKYDEKSFLEDSVAIEMEKEIMLAIILHIDGPDRRWQSFGDIQNKTFEGLNENDLKQKVSITFSKENV